MGIEIERKFLLATAAWRNAVGRSERLVQGYLTRADERHGYPPCSVRVRAGADAAWLNIKAAVPGIERREFEYVIPRADAEQMLAEFCPEVVEKIRHHVLHAGMTFEVDEFLGANAGLIVAELELPSAGAAFARPPWLGKEVSDMIRYYNLNLLQHPYSCWSETERAGN